MVCVLILLQILFLLKLGNGAGNSWLVLPKYVLAKFEKISWIKCIIRDLIMSSSWQLISPTFKDRFQRAIQSQYIHIEENVKNHFFLTGAFPWVCLIIFKLNVITAYFSYLSLTKNGKTKCSRKHVFGFFLGHNYCNTIREKHAWVQIRKSGSIHSLLCGWAVDSSLPSSS